MSGNLESSSKVVKINTENVDKIFDCNELVVIMFGLNFKKTCKHASILEEVAIKVSELYTDPGKVLIGKSNGYDSWISYYSQHYSYPFERKPNVRFFINKKLATKIFSSDITVSNLVSYIQNLLENSIQEISNISIPSNPIKTYKEVIIGYFKNKNTPDYQVFKNLSMIFMDDCQFYARFGEEYCTMYPAKDHNKPLITFKISDQPFTEFEQDIFKGNSLDFESFYSWANENVSYSTREITFDNSKEIQKDHPISLIMFYNPDDLEPVKRFKDTVKTDLKEYCRNISCIMERIKFLTANGVQFSKKLQEIEKSQTDLPFLLLVRNDVIYQFPENYDVTSILSNQLLKTLLSNFLSDHERYLYDRYNDQKCCFDYGFYKKGRIYPAYKFNLFSEFSKKPIKYNRNKLPDSAADNFCVSLFDE